jgi:hypothetical protein
MQNLYKKTEGNSTTYIILCDGFLLKITSNASEAYTVYGYLINRTKQTLNKWSKIKWKEVGEIEWEKFGEIKLDKQGKIKWSEIKWNENGWKKIEASKNDFIKFIESICEKNTHSASCDSKDEAGVDEVGGVVFK